jgi:hypothetical protein
MSTPEIQGIYYPCFDKRQPVCRQYVNQQWCRKRLRCNFYHPLIITPTIKKKATRKLGHCYCGAPQKCLMNRKLLRKPEDPTFFVVCSRTRRSMKKCLSIN